jgi:SAM-dependent methyltransferase
MKSWKEDILGSQDFAVDNHGIIHGTVNSTDSYLFHKNYTKGAHLRKLKEKKFHQIYWETPYYLKILNSFLNKDDFNEMLFLDFGCGDGRITQYLLENHAEKIVCVDFDYATLVSLSEYLEDNQLTDKVMMLYTDYENLVLPHGKFDLILAIGVLYYLNEKYESALRNFRSLLKHEGRLILSDPDLEGSLLRMLLYDSLESAIEAFKLRRFKETKNQSEFHFRIFDEKEWKSIFARVGFAIDGKRKISLFHNIIRVLQIKGIITENQLEKNEADIWEILNYLHEHGSLSKHIVWSLIRK